MQYGDTYKGVKLSRTKTIKFPVDENGVVLQMQLIDEADKNRVGYNQRMNINGHILWKLSQPLK